MSVKLSLQGAPHAVVDGERLEISPSRPALLLLYLALAGDWTGRERLAWLFRPDGAEDRARANLRLLLTRARRFRWAAGLETERQRLRFQVEVVQPDVVLPGGILLEGWTAEGPLGAWLDSERAAWTARQHAAELQHARELQAAGRHEEALALTRHLLRADPLAEDVLQVFMVASMHTPFRLEALERWQAFRQQLGEELGLEPLPATAELAERLTEPARSGALPETPVPSDRLPGRRVFPFTGRTEELAAAAAVPAGVTGVVTGEPGSGRSRFLRQFLHAAPQLWITGRRALREVAWLPLTAVLRSLPDLPRLVRELPELWRQELAALLPELRLNHEGADGTRLLEALTGLLLLLGRGSGPLHLVFTDAGWLDPGTRQLLSHAAGQPGFRVWVTGTLEDVAGLHGAGPLREIALPPLNREEIGSLVRHATGTAPALEAVRQLEERTGGNALFLTELLRTPGAVPTTVQELVRTRLALLSPDERRLLDAAAVLDAGFSVRQLAELSALSEGAAARLYAALETAGLLRAGGFAHGIVRECVLADLRTGQREHLHARTAALLRAERQDDLLVAEHLQKAGRTEEAAGLWFSAASVRFSSQPGYEAEAEALYRRIMASGVRGPAADRARAYLAGRLLVRGQQEQALELIRQVLDESADDLARSFALCQQALVHYLHGELSEAERACSRALRQAETVEQAALHDDLQLLHSLLLHARQRFSEALAISSRMLERQRLRPKGFALSNWLSRCAADLCALGRYEEALALYEEQLAVARWLQQPRQQVLAANDIMATLDDLDRIGESLELGVAARALGDYDVTWPLLYHLALAHRARGDAAAAKRDLEELLAGSPSVNTRAWALALQVEMASEDGDTPAARMAVQLALDLIAGTDLPEAQAAVALAAARYGSAAQRRTGLEHLKKLHGTGLSDRLRKDAEAVLAAAGEIGLQH